MPGAFALAIAAAVITIVTVTLVLFAMLLGRVLKRLDENKREREQQAIIERMRRY